MTDDTTDTDAFLALFENPGFARTEASPCNYHPERSSVLQAFRADRLAGLAYQRFMDHRFRRSGNVIYRPCCPHCSACVPLRVPVADFRPSRSQRRAFAKNHDVELRIQLPRLDQHRIELYQRYLAFQHPHSPQSDSPDALRRFLYTSPVDTWEMGYYLGSHLIAVSIVDCCSQSFSSVYHFFDPELAQRSLGVFSVLREIALARERKVPFYYLGYWVEACATMEYKRHYQPHQLLIDGCWQAQALVSQGGTASPPSPRRVS